MKKYTITLSEEQLEAVKDATLFTLTRYREQLADCDKERLKLSPTLVKGLKQMVYNLENAMHPIYDVKED